MERLINIKDVSDYLGVSLKTVYHWTHIGFIPHYKFPKGIRFRLSEIDNWVKRRKHDGREKAVPKIEI